MRTPRETDRDETKGMARTAGSANAPGQTVICVSRIIGDREIGISPKWTAHTTTGVPGVKSLREKLRGRLHAVRYRRIVGVVTINLASPKEAESAAGTEIQHIPRGANQYAASTISGP